MTVFVALLRAVNVGGTGKLPMPDLVALCEKAGFSNIRTYIASGNAVFSSDSTEATIKEQLESALEHYAGKPVGVLVRCADEIAAVLDANPFPDAPGNKVMTLFLGEAPDQAMIEAVSNRTNEELRLGARELYVHYPDGMGKSKLKIPAAAHGTARNMNTVAELVGMSAAL